PHRPHPCDEGEVLLCQRDDRNSGEIDLLVTGEMKQQVERPFKASHIHDQFRLAGGAIVVVAGPQPVHGHGAVALGGLGLPRFRPVVVRRFGHPVPLPCLPQATASKYSANSARRSASRPSSASRIAAHARSARALEAPSSGFVRETMPLISSISPLQ